MVLSQLFHRTASLLILYSATAFTINHFLSPISPRINLSLLLITSLYTLKLLLAAIIAEYKLDKLGSRAPRIADYSPFGLWTLFRALRDFAAYRNHVFWWQNFTRNGNPRNPYTTESIIFGGRLCFTADEENVKAILATQFAEFGKGPQFRKEWRDFLGLSIFTTDGDMWHNSRSLLRPQFIKDRVSDLQKFEARVQVLLPMLSPGKESADGQTVRVDELFYRFALDAATDFLLGKSVDSLLNSGTQFADAFGEVQRVQAMVARAGPLQHFVPKKSFHAGLKVLNEFVNQYIDQALQLSPGELEKVTKSDEGYTFLHALASHTRDRQVLRDQIVAVLLAGRDTTAVTLSWLFYELSRRPGVVQKLREEIVGRVGVDRQPSYDDMKAMRYLQHTLNETLRLYPVVPYNVREALEDTTLPHGGGADGNEPIGVLKGTAVGYSTFILHRRPEIYPDPSTGFPDYLDFVPERWESWTPKPWTYIPFNGGPRICIGQQFALTEMSYVICRIFQTFSRVESKQDEHPGFRSDIVLQPANGVEVAFYR